MTGIITISNLKGISYLEYSLPPVGVHLLAGANGAGKTTLLACLRRIGYSNAFPVHFPSSVHFTNLDDYGQAEIKYTVNNQSVTYGRRAQRWTPRPRQNAFVLGNFGYPSVIYAGATAERITPSAQELRRARVRRAPQILRNVLNDVFATSKFDNLVVVNLTRGAGNKAYLVPVSGSRPVKYYTEKNLGLGELCVLKLALSLQDCPNNSLVLIDELEMALHPMAQIKFVEFLKDMSAEKNLTVVVSTHSASLIKYFGKKHLSYLVVEQNRVEVLRNCFPTYALGQLGYGEERAPDVLVYVEDTAARRLSEMLWKNMVANRLGARAAYAPTVHFIEIGGIPNVLNMLIKGGGLLPEQTSVKALLDRDAKDETLQAAIDRNDLSTQQIFQQCDGQLNYLPWTPEVGIINLLDSEHAFVEGKLREQTNTAYLNLLRPSADELVEDAGPQQRKKAKSGLKRISSDIANQLPNYDLDQVKEEIYKIFSSWYFDNHNGEVQRLFGPYFD